VRSEVLPAFYNDLKTSAFAVSFACITAASARNTLPRGPWPQPMRLLGHNVNQYPCWATQLGPGRRTHHPPPPSMPPWGAAAADLKPVVTRAFKRFLPISTHARADGAQRPAITDCILTLVPEAFASSPELDSAQEVPGHFTSTPLPPRNPGWPGVAGVQVTDAVWCFAGSQRTAACPLLASLRDAWW